MATPYGAGAAAPSSRSPAARARNGIVMYLCRNENSQQGMYIAWHERQPGARILRKTVNVRNMYIA